jgi:hypothetical protein
MSNLPPNDPRHGTINGYSTLGCRCDRCRAAGTKSARRRRLRELEHIHALEEENEYLRTRLAQVLRTQRGDNG